MSNEAERNFDIGGQNSPQEKLTDENDEDVEEIDVVIKKHIRRHSGSFSNDLIDIAEASHPNFEKFVKENRRTPDIETNIDNQESESIKKCTRGTAMLFVHVLFSTIVIIFCVYQLCNPSLTPDLRTLYTSMLTSSIALYSPSPFQSKKK